MNARDQMDDTQCDNDGTLQDNEPMGMADALMSRGSFLRKLRQMELADVEERQQQHLSSQANGDSHGRCREEEDQIESLSSGKCVLRYNSYLAHQRYYDDLKHVDCNCIDYGLVRHGKDGLGHRLIVEQDKRLGKGGLCWDAAFILAEHLIANQDEWRTSQNTRVVELGSGTGLCGLMIAKAVQQCHVAITDLPELMDLMNRNVALNFEDRSIVKMNSENMGICNPNSALLADEASKQELYGDELDSSKQARQKAAGTVSCFVLRWGESADYKHGPYDVVLGTDVVASLYDPVALAHTIHALCHEKSRVYISYKGRLTGPHERFQQEFESLFENVSEEKPCSRNRNPDVRVLVATGKRSFV